MAPKWLVMYATLAAIAAITHVLFDVVPKLYPAAVGFGVPLAIAIAAAVDRPSMRAIWVPTLILSFATFNAARFHATWLIPVAFGAAAIWLFRAAWLPSNDKQFQTSRVASWIAGTVILVLGLMYGPDIVVEVLGIPTID